MKLGMHKTILRNLMPKSGEYPVALREAQSILVEEQSDLIPIYMDGMHVNFLEKRIKDTQEGDEAVIAFKQKNAHNEISNFRGNIKNLIYGMKRFGFNGFPDLMVLTDDINSLDPAIIKPENPEFSFEIKPKDFNLGITGRLLEDETGQRYNESLSVNLDIYDAFNFATSISPNRIYALTEDGRKILVNIKGNNIGKQESVTINREENIFVMDDTERDCWMGDIKVLPTEGLKIIFSDFYEKIKKYRRSTLLFGHKYQDINEFLSLVTAMDDHIIWKICQKEIWNPNTPLIDARPYYGEYKEKPRYENINRLHFMPHKANLWFEGTMITFNQSTGIKALMDLGDVVKDIWFEPISTELNNGWDIIFDRSRGITPKNKIRVYNDADYQKYPVLKE